MPIDLTEFAASAGAEAAAIPRKEGWALLQGWREVYCAPVREATGKWVERDGCAWHTFSNGFFPSVQRQRALDRYRAEHPAELLVLPEDNHVTAIRYASATPIDFSGLLLDLYIAPATYAWTMAFTHEHPDLGPYFSRAEWLGR